MNTRTQPALTESASNGLRPPVDGNIIMGNVDPGTWARSKRATRWKTDEDVLLAIGGAACCGRASGDQHILKDDQTHQPVKKSQDAQEVAWGAGEIALGRPFSLLRRPCSQTDPSEDPLAVQSGFWMPS